MTIRLICPLHFVCDRNIPCEWIFPSYEFGVRYNSRLYRGEAEGSIQDLQQGPELALVDGSKFPYTLFPRKEVLYELAKPEYL